MMHQQTNFAPGALICPSEQAFSPFSPFLSLSLPVYTHTYTHFPLNHLWVSCIHHRPSDMSAHISQELGHSHP